MKSTTVFGATVLALVARYADAFFLPAGGLAGGALPTPPLSQQSTVSTVSGSTAALAVGHAPGCTCTSCALSQGRSCGCPRCSSGRCSGGAGCRCGACSVRMQAHPQGCGCGECSPAPPAAFRGSCCSCADCATSCTCGQCTSRPAKRGASSATVMGMGAGEVSGEGYEGLRERLAQEPGAVMFGDAMAAIESGFDYSPKRFVNGATSSGAGENEGSCKVFAFGRIAELSPPETLACFGEHYRGVLADPEGDSHGNIRAFMESGWDGVEFPDGLSLSPK